MATDTALISSIPGCIGLQQHGRSAAPRAGAAAPCSTSACAATATEAASTPATTAPPLAHSPGPWPAPLCAPLAASCSTSTYCALTTVRRYSPRR
eukprot:scaffold10880_cov64-Phaeocystis_antarctica.AAC.2